MIKEYFRHFMLCVSCCLIAFSLPAQLNDSCYDCKIKESCIESSVKDFQNRIIQLELEQVDSIELILNEWEKISGLNEAIERVDILIHISRTGLVDRKNSQYYTYGINKLVKRMYIVDNQIEVNNYINWEAYYDYVELDGPFDKWTQKAARRLLPLQEKGTDSHLLCLLI